MRIKVINPNTTESMTRKIGEAARAAAAIGTEIVACNPAGGPVSIEGHYDEAVSVLGLLDECKRAVAEDGAGAIVLGCAGMADLTAEVQKAIGVPVIDGVAAAVKFVEALVGMGLQTSKVGDLAWPLPKTYTGALAHMAPAPATRRSPSSSARRRGRHEA